MAGRGRACSIISVIRSIIPIIIIISIIIVLITITGYGFHAHRQGGRDEGG